MRSDFTLKDIKLINRCFTEIEEFNLCRKSQIKLVLFVNEKIKENTSLRNEINRLRSIIKKNQVLN